MTFWLNVALGYVLLLGLGTAIGALLGSRRRGDGGGSGKDPAVPGPTDPTHALECPPLGSAFDRALLPAAFADELTVSLR